MNLSKLRSWKPNYLALAFFMPFLAFVVLMIVVESVPFGSNSLLCYDMWHQYFPFFKAFRKALLSGESLLYSWSVGIGMDYLGLISYYLASPLNLLSVLVPDDFACFAEDKVHPNDVGFAIYAQSLQNKITEILNLE